MAPESDSGWDVPAEDEADEATTVTETAPEQPEAAAEPVEVPSASITHESGEDVTVTLVVQGELRTFEVPGTVEGYHELAALRNVPSLEVAE